ncbi:MAG: phage tail protein [Candidatus Promineifilaceae bacterium]|nr:phage tail protein [Candidatus Promineifilaceae bacterium]
MSVDYGKDAFPGHRFSVEIEGQVQAIFLECTVPTVEYEVEPIKEGGLNTHVHYLPGRRKEFQITLKKGLGTASLMDWYIDMMSEIFVPKKVEIHLHDSTGDKIVTWRLDKALPIKWAGPSLKTSDSAIATESLDFKGEELTVTRY